MEHESLPAEIAWAEIDSLAGFDVRHELRRSQERTRGLGVAMNASVTRTSISALVAQLRAQRTTLQFAEVMRKSVPTDVGVRFAAAMKDSTSSRPNIGKALHRKDTE